MNEVSILKKWKALLTDKTYVISLIVGAVLLCLAYALTYCVSSYHDQITYLSVGDFILDKIPTYDLEFLFTYGIYFVVLMIAFFTVFLKPEIAPFVLKSYALLFVVRVGFITLTHVGPPEGFFYESGVNVGIDPLRRIIFKNDLFFSGHTSIPFMAFLLFRDLKWRVFFLIASLLMGVTVLLMHVHYSIDVFAAFFITHGIYSLSSKIFEDLNIRFISRLHFLYLPEMNKKISKYIGKVKK